MAHTAAGEKVVPVCGACGDRSEVYIKPSFRSQGFGKRVVIVLDGSKSEQPDVADVSLGSCRQVSEGTRIQDPVHFSGGCPTLNGDGQGSDLTIVRCVLYGNIFPSAAASVSVKCNHSETDS